MKFPSPPPHPVVDVIVAVEKLHTPRQGFPGPWCEACPGQGWPCATEKVLREHRRNLCYDSFEIEDDGLVFVWWNEDVYSYAPDLPSVWSGGIDRAAEWLREQCKARLVDREPYVDPCPYEDPRAAVGGA